MMETEVSHGFDFPSGIIVCGAWSRLEPNHK